MTENKFEGYFSYYISRADDLPLIEALTRQEKSLTQFLESINPELLDYAYAEGKWTVKEVVFHIIETEIIMLYRAIRCSRGDLTPLPGYDENMLIEKARVQGMSYDALLKLFKHSRSNSLFYFSHMTEEELEHVGTFSNLKLNTRGLGYLICGHADHHIEILNERYLKQNNL